MRKRTHPTCSVFQPLVRLAQAEHESLAVRATALGRTLDGVDPRFAVSDYIGISKETMEKDGLRGDAVYEALFELIRWQGRPTCPRCGGGNIEKTLEPQPYRCRSCRPGYFSVLTGTVLENTNRSMLKKWLLALHYRYVDPGITARKLAGAAGISRATAGRMLDGLRDDDALDAHSQGAAAHT